MHTSFHSTYEYWMSLDIIAFKLITENILWTVLWGFQECSHKSTFQITHHMLWGCWSFCKLSISSYSHVRWRWLEWWLTLGKIEICLIVGNDFFKFDTFLLLKLIDWFNYLMWISWSLKYKLLLRNRKFKPD